MKSKYQKIEEKAEKSKDKLYDNLTIVLNALPIIKPTAKSNTFPLEINVLNSFKNFFILLPPTNS